MFGPNTIGTGLSFTRVLGGLSRVLGIANQAIPIYKEIKPMIGNARKVMGVLKEFNKTNISNPSEVKNTIDVSVKKEVIDTPTTSSNPVFFQ